MKWFEISIIMYSSSISVRNSEKVGLGVLAETLEVEVRCQLVLQLLRGLTKAGGPPPQRLAHIRTSWCGQNGSSPKRFLQGTVCVSSQHGGWFSPEQEVQDIKQKWQYHLSYSLRSHTPYSVDLIGQSWLHLGEVYTRMWILGGHSGDCFVLLLSFYFNCVILSSVLSKDSLLFY